MSGQVFISYRHKDASAWASRLYDCLAASVPRHQISMDVDIPPGVNPVEAIVHSVSSCDVLIAVIGKGWLTAANEKGKRQLDWPGDHVHMEIATALKRDIRVIPILVDGALMPSSADLPEDLKPLVHRNALTISHERFQADSERLIGVVEQALESVRVELRREREELERFSTEWLEEQRLQAQRRARQEEERLEAEAHKRRNQEKERLSTRAKVRAHVFEPTISREQAGFT